MMIALNDSFDFCLFINLINNCITQLEILNIINYFEVNIISIIILNKDISIITISSIILFSNFGKKVIENAVRIIQVGAGGTVIATGINTGFGTKLAKPQSSGNSAPSNQPSGQDNSSSSQPQPSNSNDNNGNK